MAFRYNAEAVGKITEHAEARSEAARQGKPTPKMFMYLALQCAHAPNEPDVFGLLYPSDTYTNDYINYNGMISAVDSVVGNVTDALKVQEMWETALVCQSAATTHLVPCVSDQLAPTRHLNALWVCPIGNFHVG